jgi:chromosome segregation ATPase
MTDGQWTIFWSGITGFIAAAGPIAVNWYVNRRQADQQAEDKATERKTADRKEAFDQAMQFCNFLQKWNESQQQQINELRGRIDDCDHKHALAEQRSQDCEERHDQLQREHAELQDKVNQLTRTVNGGKP